MDISVNGIAAQTLTKIIITYFHYNWFLLFVTQQIRYTGVWSAHVYFILIKEGYCKTSYVSRYGCNDNDLVRQYSQGQGHMLPSVFYTSFWDILYISNLNTDCYIIG
jgi:hypothetical protein